MFATQSYILKPGFHARAGSTVTVRIDPSGGTVLQGDYDVSNLTYDANGNILSLTRNAQGAMDDLSYTYKADKPNQLLRVDDTVADTAVANADIDDQDGNNYGYNAIGQLIRNNTEDIDYFYNASGLVAQVDQGGQPAVKFHYNDRNHRIKKESYVDGNLNQTTYYVRDVAGQVMAIYSDGGGSMALVERPIYGSGRIGVAYTGGNTLYELTDHLGNVRAVFTKDQGNAELEGYTDYYPGGMAMPGRRMRDADQYRYSYQGQFSEKDDETGHNFFERRLYDSRILRWLRPDDVRRTTQSPYMAMGNNPVLYGDPDGRDIIILNSSMAVGGLGHAAVLIGNDRDGWRYFSKNGTQKNIKTGYGLAGPSINPNDGTGTNDFRNTGLTASQVIRIVNQQYMEEHPDGERYDRFIRIKTTPEQDEISAIEASNQMYSFYTVDKFMENNNDPCAGSCLDVAKDALRPHINGLNTFDFLWGGIVPNYWIANFAIWQNLSPQKIWTPTPFEYEPGVFGKFGTDGDFK